MTSIQAGMAIGVLFASWSAVVAAELPSTERVQGVLSDVAVEVDRLPMARLESLYLGCARVSQRRLLDSNEAVVCSVAAESLKRKRFGGDFEALVAWWRGQRSGANDD